MIFALGAALVLRAALDATFGRLIYVLDDPYIHLALAENIARGHYGINLSEPSSPSSSVLYPFLLAPFFALGLREVPPLLIALLAQGVAVFVLARFLWDELLTGIGMPRTRLVIAALAALLLPLAINSWGLPFTGMEHSIHVLTTVLVLVGLHATSQGDRTLYLVPAIWLNAMIRFEGFALSTAAILALFFLRRPREAGAALGLTGMSVLAYAGFMKSLGLPLLPSSVMVKSDASANLVGGDLLPIVAALGETIATSLGKYWGVLFAVVGLAGLPLALRPSASQAYRVLYLVGASALLAHLALGKYGGIGRYESYGAAIAVILVTLVVREALSAPRLRHGVVFSLLVICAIPFSGTAVLVPAAARNIYDQQYQMHRFATEFFPERVAVNDLGWVSFENDTYVLDLHGLGSEVSRRIQAETGGHTADTLRRLTERHDVEFVMIYDQWFEEVAEKPWCLVGVLGTSAVIAAGSEVSIYVVDPAKMPEIQAALRDWRSSLPETAGLELFDCDRRAPL
ncbi:hypothetical protein [Rhodovulum sp. YNF3179]|uniref:hypothetical protein n=1 Tax=Rhodovulum sp. YNF3179 TaxID=3425127 RepID=UPI003D3292D6